MRRVAMEQEASKKGGVQLTLSSYYLILYNFAQTLGWTIILVKLLIHIFAHGTYVGLYNELKLWLNVFQTLAVLEILHAATGIVRSNAALTAFQVASRLFLVWGIVHLVDEARDQIGFPLLVFAWSVTEVIRYPFYLGAIVNYTPFVLQYLRVFVACFEYLLEEMLNRTDSKTLYTLFIVLYPMGVTGEIISVYNSLHHVKERGILTQSLPNRANMSFNYYYLLMATMLLYVRGFPQLYFHMFSQRKKVLGPAKQDKAD